MKAVSAIELQNYDVPKGRKTNKYLIAQAAPMFFHVSLSSLIPLPPTNARLFFCSGE
jgi:hypothetical protein